MQHEVEAARSPRTTSEVGVVSVRLAGRLSVAYGHRTVDADAFRGRQGRLVFAFLVTNHRPVTRDELAELLWADDIPTAWDSNLSAIVSRLRSLLERIGLDGSEVISGARGTYEFRPPGDLWVDIAYAERSLREAEAAVAAGEQRRGAAAAAVARDVARRPLLPGDESPWLEQKRSETRELLVRASEVLADAQHACGDLTSALRVAEEVVKLEPFRESGYRRLMAIHADAGNRAEALQTWERCRGLLAEELGVEPSPETEALYLELLRKQPAAPEPPPEAVEPPPAAAAQTTPAAVVPVPPPRTGTVALLFTDLVGSTELLGSLGDQAADTVRRAHFDLLREAVTSRGGQIVKSLGDGVMVVFDSIVEAVASSVAIQVAVDSYNRRSDVRLGVRIGMHVGEPIVHDDDYFGMPVVVARRLCDVAEGGQILVSSLIHGLVASRGGFEFEHVGPLELKGVPDPVDSYRVAWSPSAPERIPLPPLVELGERLTFVGRRTELSALADRLEAAASRARLVTIPGEPGIGKTRLVSEFARAAHGAGALVLIGRSEEEAIVPYQPFVEALSHFIAASSLESLRHHLGGGAADLARLLPEVASRMPDVVVPSSGDTENERYRVFEAVANMLASLGRSQPVVLILEDLHWADRPTALLLRHLLRHRDLAGLLVVGTFRDTEVGPRHPIAEIIADLHRDDLVDRIEPPPLSPDEVGALLEAVAGAAAVGGGRSLSKEVHRTTDGNPLFVREVVRHLAETGGLEAGTGLGHAVPESVKDITQQRVSRLPDPAPRLLSLASVIGREFDLDVLIRVSQLSEDEVVEALETAVAARIVDEIPRAIDRYGFSHALVRDAMYEGLSATRRTRLHRTVAETIEALHADDVAPHAAELAYHLSEAGPASAPQALRYSRQAAEHAIAQLAFEEAATHQERALRALDTSGADDPEQRMDILLGLGDALSMGGQAAAASDAYRRALEIARARSLPTGVARAALGIATQWTETGEVDEERVAALEEALAGLPSDELMLRARVLGALATAVYHDPTTAERREALTAEAVEIARECGAPTVIANALIARNFAVWGPDTPTDLEENAAEVVRLGEESGDAETILSGLTWVKIGAIRRSNLDDYEAALERYDTVAHSSRLARHVWYAMTRRATLAILRGRLDEGAMLSRAAFAAGSDMGENDAPHVHNGQMSFVWMWRDDAEGLERIAKYYSALASERSGLSGTSYWWRATVLESLASVGQSLDETRTFVDEVIESGLPSIGRLHYHWLPVRAQVADLAAYAGDRASAARLYEELLPYTGRLRDPSLAVPDGPIDHTLGRLAQTMGDLDAAVRHLEDADALCRRLRLRPWLVVTQLELAKALADRDPARATSVRDEALRAAEEMAMTRLLDQLRSLPLA